MDLTGKRMMSITTGIQPTLPEPSHPLILIQFHILTCVGNDPCTLNRVTLIHFKKSNQPFLFSGGHTTHEPSHASCCSQFQI